MAQTAKAICCHCSVKCGVLIDIEDGAPRAIRGDPSHPQSRGFICPRGRAAIEYFHHLGRLNTPLKRVGERGAGRWQPVSWDEALDDIAMRLGAIRDQYGPEAVGHLIGTFHGSDQGAGIRFMNLFGSPNYGGIGFICAGPKIVAETLLFGFGPAQPDIKPGTTKCILLWAHRPSSSRPPFWGHILNAKRSGAALIVIDPIETKEAQVADLWLKVRPNTDAALALGLLHVLIHHQLYDAEFVSHWTIGFDALTERTAQYTPTTVSEITGVPSAQLIHAAQLFATSSPAALAQGLPNGMGQNAFSYELAKSALMAISGNLNRPGGNRLAAPPHRVLTKNDFEAYDRLPATQRAERLGGDRFPLHVEGYERISAAQQRRWPQHQRILTASFGAVAHPPTILRAIREGQPYPVKALLIQHNNPLGCYPNATLVRDALKSPNLDLLVVHELFMTPTAMLADYVIPAASWMEKSYMYVAGQDEFILGTPQAVSPMYDRRSDYDFFRELGIRLGQKADWVPRLEDLWDGMLQPADLSFTELTRQFPNGFNDVEPTTDPARHDLADLATPSGKIELAPTILSAIGVDSLPIYRDFSPQTQGQQDYPLILMTGATHLDMTHQDHRQIATLRRRHPHPVARLHPDTATEWGLADGDWTWLESPLGRIRQIIALDRHIPINTVQAERWWYPEHPGPEPDLFNVLDSNVNVLTPDDPEFCDPTYGSWPYRKARCRLIKCEGL